MKVGVLVEGQEGFGWPEWRAVVGWAEDLGLESLWCSDHLAPLDGGHGVASLDTYVALTQAAATTSRIGLGSLVSPLTVRHPVTLARTAAAIDALCGGRFRLGLGAGWHAAEHDRFGIGMPGPRDRVRALDEGAGVVRALLTGRTISVEGEIFRLCDADIRPASPVPLVIGGGGEQTLRAVARHADEWNLPAVARPAYRRKAAALARHCERLGRDPAAIERSVVLGQAIGETPGDARRALAALTAGTPPEYRPGAGPDAPFWLAGTPDDVVEDLLGLAEEGIHRVMLQYRTFPARRHLELVATEVVPRVAGTRG